MTATLGELRYGAKKSARRAETLTAIEHFVARLDVLPFGDKVAAHYGQVRAELERAGTRGRVNQAARIPCKYCSTVARSACEC